MYLLVHNARIVQIQTPPTPGDPIKGITGSAGTIRWSGDAQAWIDEDLIDTVRNNQLVTLSQTMIRIPVNMPVTPNEQDLVTIVRLDSVQPASQAAPASEVMTVRTIDQGNILQGIIILRCVRGGST